MDPNTLPAEQRIAFTHAARARGFQIGAQFFVAIVGVLSVLTDNHLAAYALAILGFLGVVAWLVADWYGRSLRDAGERFRRATLVVGGLGVTLAPQEQMVLADASRATPAQVQAASDPNYYASLNPPSPMRVAEMLEESAFWTSTLQRESARLVAIGLAALLAIATVVVLAILPKATSEAMIAGVRIGIAAALFFLSSDVYGALVGHWTTASEVERIKHRLIDVQSRGAPLGDVLVLLGDYNSAVEKAPLTLGWAYSARRDELNTRWTAYQASKPAAARGATP